ncbi:hypothetical protein EST38_g9417 [Candolleomyces aberdarensis]|uniref:CP-type G domain-containing protein n=1 Tax=Candolleomyces aberdarensis TaxID=2316362 RepID=A0A4Q2D9Y3_9AGAR|nr:hypothetical protein EST38_g9417 [Candolleomyces aberdarensis]
MPRIRKKTSNRTKIHERARLKKQVKETKRKKAKQAKKNPQWKSKTKKDPGIPNDFPYKDQILAEVAEQRRLAAEEKERRKEEKRLAREQPKGNDQDDEDKEGQSDNEESETPAAGKKGLNVGADAIASLSAKIVSGEIKARPEPKAAAVEDSDDEEVPALVNRDLPTLKSVLDASDVLLQVIDARDPLEYRSQHLEGVAKERGLKFALVLNKIDSCPRETVSAWLSHLRSQHPTFLFRSATAFLPPPAVNVSVGGKGKTKSPVDDALGAESLISYLTRLAQEKDGDEQLTVAVVGVTNAGKSSVINSLTKQSALPVYSLANSSRSATTTELPQEVSVEVEGKQIRIIDTPGLSFDFDRSAENKDELRGRDILLRSRGRIDKLKDPSPPITYIISRANNEDLMLLYNLAAFARDEPIAFLSGVARSNQLVKKRGELDLAGASRVVLRDWSIGKFARYATPVKAQSSSTPSPEEWLAALYLKGDEAVLATLKPRKELRKTAGLGLVRFSSGSIDDRTVRIEDEWAVLDHEDSEDEEDDSGEFGMEVDGGSGSDESMDAEDDDADEDDEEGESSGPEMDNEEEEEVEIPVTDMKKRKRGLNPPLQPRPSKKVAFASTKGKQVLSTSAKPQKEDKAPPSSILKKQEPRAAKKPSTRPVKVANVPPSNKAKLTEGGSEAYDFSQFFK